MQKINSVPMTPRSQLLHRLKTGPWNFTYILDDQLARGHVLSGQLSTGISEAPGFYACRSVSSFTPLNSLQKAAVAVLSAVQAAKDPSRADLVAALGETTGELAFTRMRDRMRQSVSGRELLQLRPRMTDTALEHVYQMKSYTFGGAYAEFMRKRHFHADDRPPVRFIADEEVAYVAARSREVHDLWHVLFRCPTTVLGELALKGMEFVQTGLPMTALSVAGAQWRLKQQDRSLLWRHYMPWALRAGAAAPDLLCLHYERHFEEDLDVLRRKWNIQVAPTRTKLQ